ncbi:substrate-binding domain-containing protein [Deinococcus sp. S9]|uniref:substrate-binding domain-containing protein n=1 Tax=Deinococcus sp. S9 TaxID=2545754 RepID=UPI0010542DCC|nr:substrate-binding domain-containing protein [Deinococcus sp. S9]TDE84755.1 sugar ABC transporter substrate-binding protein [Deinococcus sp. S9]
MKHTTKIALAATALVSVALAQGTDPQAALKQLSTKVFSKGPNGETAAPVSQIKLTPAELAKVKAMNATAAIVLHYGGNDWSNAQVDGLKSQFAKLGIKVIAVTDANFKPEKQVSDIETVLARKPDIIVSIPTDPVATAAAYKAAAKQGVKLVFMDNVPSGLKAGKDYVSVVSSDNYGNGVASAYLLAQQLGGKGNIGVIYHAADFFVTKQRYDAFKNTIKQFPGIKIVAEQGIGGPDFAGDAEKVASAMLTRHPNLDAIWAVWDVPAEGVISAARTAGRKDLIIATMDLGKNVAIDMARKNGMVKGLGAQRPFDAGVAEANLAAYGLLGKKAPAYVALNALPVTRGNLLTAWKQVYNQSAPSEIQSALK